MKEVRVENGLTQEELADRCRLDIRTIQRIEAGKVKPRMYTMRIINETLGTNIRDSFDDESAKQELAALRRIFQKRRKIRILTAGAAIALMAGVVILSDSNWNLFGMPKRVWAPYFYLALFIHLIGIAFTWRCPGCNGLLGDVFSTRFCPKCGMNFYDRK